MRLARDCQIVVDGGVADAGRGTNAQQQQQQYAEQKLGQAAVNLAFASVIQRRAQVAITVVTVVAS